MHKMSKLCLMPDKTVILSLLTIWTLAQFGSTRASDPSVIQIRADDTRPEAHLDRVADALKKYSAVIEQGTIITIDPNKTRLHILPFVLPENNDG